MRTRVLAAIACYVSLAPIAVAAAPTAIVIGRVVDGDAGLPLPRASIVVDGAQRGTVSDRDGNYRLRGVPAGTHTLRVSYIGFQGASATAELSAGQTRRLDFALQAASSRRTRSSSWARACRARRGLSTSSAPTSTSPTSSTPIRSAAFRTPASVTP